MGRAGVYRKQTGGYTVFIPKKLPPQPPLKFDDELVGLEEKANLTLGELKGLSEVIPNPDHFITMYVRKEALLSSQIEGTQASLEDLIESETKKEYAIPAEIREILNYIDALYYGLNKVKKIPVSLRLIKEIHQILLQGVRGENRNPGNFRTSQNWIGIPGTSINEAEFVPPPIDEMNIALDDFEKYYHHDKMTPSLIKCAMLHAQFETIHPFMDGNGRIGRLLITLFLCEMGILEAPLLYLSYYFKKNRQEYYQKLMDIRNDGDWEGWLKFFLIGVFETSKQAIETAKNILGLKEKHRRMVRDSTNSAIALDVLNLLYHDPIVDVKFVTKRLGVSEGSVRNTFKHFIDIGILKLLKGKARYRVYHYRQYINIMKEGTEL